MSDTAPHYLLDGLAGWRAGALKNTVLLDNGRYLALQALPGSIRPLVDSEGSFGGLQMAIGVALDSQNRVYVLDGQACTLKRFNRCAQKFVTLPCIGGIGPEPRLLRSPHGLAISCEGNLFVADTGNRRVQMFSVKGLALRQILGPFQVVQSAAGISIERTAATATYSPGGVDCDPHPVFSPGTWEPWDVAISPRNWIYVSDYSNGLIHVFNPHGCWVRAYTGAGRGLPQLLKPTRLALDREGRIYVVQEGQSVVVVLGPDGSVIGTVGQPSEVEGRFCPVSVAVDYTGNLCLGDCVARKAYFYQPDGDGGWCPTRCFATGNSLAAALIFDEDGNPIFADGAQRVCQLSPQTAYETCGTFYSCPLDSRTYRCLWHRVVLHGCIPPGTSVRVDTFTAESPKSIDEIHSLPESRWATRQIDTDTESSCWDCLSLSPPGRYFWLRLTLSGNGSATPTIRCVKVYYPRASSLQYLPGVYRQDPVSADFLARFLSIFDTLRGFTSDQITDMARLFDSKSTPANPKNVGGTDFLSWLASWLGLALQSNWPIHKRRELLRQAHRLFALRGTPEGMKLQIKLYTGFEPRILELFRLRRWLMVGSSKLGDQSAVFGDAVMNRLEVAVNSSIGSFQLVDYGDPSLDLFNAYAYQFIVIVPRWPGATQADELSLQQIIAMAKPAHTLATLQWDEPRFRIGLQSLVGIDTVLSRYPAGVIEGQGKLGYDTVLGNPAENSRRPSASVGCESRIGCDTLLN